MHIFLFLQGTATVLRPQDATTNASAGPSFHRGHPTHSVYGPAHPPAPGRPVQHVLFHLDLLMCHYAACISQGDYVEKFDAFEFLLESFVFTRNGNIIANRIFIIGFVLVICCCFALRNMRNVL